MIGKRRNSFINHYLSRSVSCTVVPDSKEWRVKQHEEEGLEASSSMPLEENVLIIRLSSCNIAEKNARNHKTSICCPLNVEMRRREKVH